MRYAFVAEHRGEVLRTGDVLMLALSKRAREDLRQTKMRKEAWVESGRVYGHRKLHDDLIEQDERVCVNRVALLLRLAGIKAQTG